MNSDLLNTDGPLTRSKRRALTKTGMTPVAGELGGATPNLLQETPMARELFTDKTNIVDQARSFQSIHGKDSSPINGWAANGTPGDIFKINPDKDNELPVTPNLFSSGQKPDVQHQTPASSVCVHGPTPNNTPAAGCILSMPAPTLLSQAVNELKEEAREHDENNVNVSTPTKHVEDLDDSDIEDLDADVNVHEGAEGHEDHEEEEQCSEDNDPRIAELLEELDHYVLGSPADAAHSEHAVAQICPSSAIRMSEAASGVAQVLALTPPEPAVADDISSVIVEPPSVLMASPAQAGSAEEVQPVRGVQKPGASIVRENETRHTTDQVHTQVTPMQSIDNTSPVSLTIMVHTVMSLIRCCAGAACVIRSIFPAVFRSERVQ
eukprot:jgi/Ulvmu1/287/UM001_0291.1